MPLRKQKKNTVPVSHMAYRFLALPDEEQKHMLSKTFGCVRYLYNQMLNDRSKCYKNFGESLSLTPAWYKHISCCKWLAEVDSLALANVQLNLNTAFRNFFDGRSKYPKFKKKSNHFDSYTTNVTNGNIKVRITGKTIFLTLPKIPGEITVRKHRTMQSDGVLKSVTVSREPDGKYYVSLLYEFSYVKPVYKVDATKTIGLDMSMPGFYVDSEGCMVDTPHAYRKMQERIGIEQRKLSHMNKGSSNYRKQRLKIARLHAKAKHQRSDFLHKASRRLVDAYDIIGIENINMKGMSQTLNFGKSVSDKGWGAFVNMLTYKAENAGKQVVKVSQWFPSSQKCHDCGYLNKKTKNLLVRDWTCPHCGTHHNRDINSAVNIKEEAVRIYCTAV